MSFGFFPHRKGPLRVYTWCRPINVFETTKYIDSGGQQKQSLPTVLWSFQWFKICKELGWGCSAATAHCHGMCGGLASTHRLKTGNRLLGIMLHVAGIVSCCPHSFLFVRRSRRFSLSTVLRIGAHIVLERRGRWHFRRKGWLALTSAEFVLWRYLKS